ncbi:hypothetical protein GQ457_15G022190 [Hibiscus cannabinus]
MTNNQMQERTPMALQTKRKESFLQKLQKKAIQNIKFSSFSQKARKMEVFAQEEIPIPHIQASVYLGKLEKPIPIIAFIDRGTAETIMNPDVLPSEWWKPHIKYLNSAADQMFATHLISKPITIEFFPGCAIKTTFLGSHLHGKDLVVGFDLYTEVKHLRILPSGLKYKGMFKPFVDIPRLYLAGSMEIITSTIKELKIKACAEHMRNFYSNVIILYGRTLNSSYKCH